VPFVVIVAFVFVVVAQNLRRSSLALLVNGL
jgi:hypothetical protein